MKRLSFILILLFVATTTVFSQTFRLNVTNEPLNITLTRLGLEISFDDRALSEYTVSVSKSFDNPEKALIWLLDDKPFRIEKIGKVYVIVPYSNKQQDNSTIAIRQTANERFIFRGTVISQTGGELLEYATVSLFDQHDNPLITGITANNGRFSIQTTRIPAKIKISYLGYETLSKDIVTLNGELGVFQLNETSFELDETVVTAEKNRLSLNRSTYAVTQDMRHGVDNALELLDKINGVSFDKLSRTVRLHNQTNILLLVDGIQQSHAYLNYISPGRIQAIEVVYALSGRFVSDDYAGIIHFILKKDYTGYDFHASNASSLNFSKSAASNRLTDNRPSVGFTCTTRKLNFFGTFEHEREDRPMFASKSFTNSASELTSIPSASPNSLSKNEGYQITGGLNYHLKPFQLIGIQADYSSGNSNSFQQYTMNRTDFSHAHSRIFTNRTDIRIKAHTLTSSLFYQGQVSNRLHLYGDFSCNYYYNDMENEYRQDEPPNYRYTDLWDERKNQTVVNVEAKYKLSDKMTFEGGYSNIWRQYASESSQGRGFLDYSEQRNKFFAYHTWYLSKKTGMKSGFALEHIRQRNREEAFGYLRALPFLLVSHEFNHSTNITAGYATSQSYPSLFHLSPISIAIDTFLTQIGNPVVKSAVRHQVFAELSLWNKLKITPQFNYIVDGVSEIYERKAFNLYRTFENMNFREYSLNVSYDLALGAHLRLKNLVILYGSEAMYRGVRSTLNGLTFKSEADFYDPRTSVGVQVGYYRNMRKNILWQGYQMADKDYWCVTVRKELWRNRISATLSYIPPIAFGVRYDRIKELNTLLYTEKSVLNLESYNQMLLLKINIRFDRGSIKPTESRTDRRPIEREKGE